ncbi:3-hydroxyacyl-CoA dehydrogenase NAD-binding domain-containing protein [Terrimonas ferruginea]|uniref:3-hydroxyacyl-CoA dehydrogenase NAD-binding domain-containing protein n=1 Tax=Terrimonas ferruginea TaxID=249 RepID=UPI0003FB7633|nr:3-hydroxyacyl-CoA dehydrogenase NAD-binding domain-containing protein [Terrimonas ferruginea]
MTINRICVCGAGTMGSGIAQVAATAGFSTLLYELNENVLTQARDQLQRQLERLESKGKLQTGEAAVIFNRIHFTGGLSECIADVFIEAIIEKPEPKAALFNTLIKQNSETAIFATNTSSLSVSAIAEATLAPSKVAGMHFFNPAPLMKLVEIVQGTQTAPEVAATLTDLTRRMGKTPVRCKDRPGFIVNRVARPYYTEALRLVEEGHADPATLDQLLEGLGFRLGPFRLMDLIGHDVNYAVSSSVYEQLGRPERLRPSYIQEALVKKGELGQKTGKGFYHYQSEK